MLACEPVNRFMTEAVLSVDLNSPAGEILRLFAAYPVHHLPVVDKTKVVGMLSSADVLKLINFIPAHVPSKEQYLDLHISVATLMRRPVVSVLPSQSIEQAATLMVTHGIHGLPVTDRDDHLLGIITTTDIMYAALHPERRGDEQGRAVPSTSAVRVSPAELDRALRLASAADETNEEKAVIARALLHTQSRLRALETVFLCADRYLRAGQDTRLHAQLSKAIERAHDERGDATPTLGL